MLFRVNLPHDILKNSLSQNEYIFIYDEPNGVAVTVENIHEKNCIMYQFISRLLLHGLLLTYKQLMNTGRK